MHATVLAKIRTKRGQVLYALEHMPRGSSIVELQSWLREHGCEPPVRTYASPIVNEWRARQGLADTGGAPQLTPELLAELDAVAHRQDTSPAPHDVLDGTHASPVRVLDAVTTPALVPPTPAPTPASGTGEANSAVKALRWVAAARGELDTHRRPRQDTVTGTAGRLWAWLAFLLGAGFSVLANVVQTLHPTPEHLAQWLADRPEATAADWTPDPVAVAFGVFWPLAVLLAVELLTRVHWQPGFLFGIVRYGGTLACAVVAGVVSYGHMRDLFLTWGQDNLTAYAGPVAVDGLMLVAAAALLSIAKGRAAARRET